MNNNFIILLVLVPMATGVMSLLAPTSPRLRHVIGVTGLAVNLAVAIAVLAAVFGFGGDPRVLVLQAGNWPAPFGITLVVDPLAALMVAVSALVLLTTYVYCVEQIPSAIRGSLFQPLFHLLGLGVQWSFITGDLFNLFVGFEIMLMSSYALLTTGGTAPQLRQAYKYVLLNLFASTMFVTCCGLLYGHLGTLNLADLARLSHGGHITPEAVPAIAVLLLVFGLKSAIFPLWFWLPDTYHTMPAGLGGLFGGLLTKVGAYVLLRMFVMVFGPAESVVADALRPLILVAAGATMFLGGLGAVSMGSIRQILSMSIISQVGYMVLGVGLGLGLGMTAEGRKLAVAGGIYFILHNMVVKTCLFLCAGLMARHAGSDDLNQMGGLVRRSPWLAVIFMLAALSLTGLPPLSGFFAKFVLIREAFRGGYHLLAAVALLASVLTLLYLLRIWSHAFWSKPFGDHVTRPEVRPQVGLGMIAASALVLVALTMGFAADVYFGAARTAARSIVDPGAYINAVLGPDQTYPLIPADELIKKGTEAP